MSDTDLKAQLAALEAENAKLKSAIDAKKNVPLTIKVSEKGAVSVYGLGRFPCTLYSTQMLKLLDHGDTIRAFIEANKSKLATKE